MMSSLYKNNKFLTSKNPKPAKVGAINVWVHSKGPAGTLLVGDRSGSELHEVKREYVQFNKPEKAVKIGLTHLRNIINETSLNESPIDEKEAGEASVDAQIDRYINEYESSSKETKNEAYKWRNLVRRIVEASDDEDDKDGGIKKLSLDDINLESFANDVVRLIDNAETLLELRNTILRRASNFLIKNYDSDVDNKFKEVLMETHGVEIGKSAMDVAEKFPAPAADRAGPDGGGGAG